MKILRSEELRVCLDKALSRLEDKKDLINKLNVFPVPDGDTGTNMNLTVKSAVNMALDKKNESCREILAALSKGALVGARGNSGVILSQIFRGFAAGVNGEELVDTMSIAKGFSDAAAQAYKAVMKPTEGTILTVAKDMAQRAMLIASRTDDIENFFSEVLIAGKISLDSTPQRLPILEEAGVVDSGGAGLLVFWEGFYEGLSGEIVDYFYNVETSEIKYKYTVSFYTKEENSKMQYALNGYKLDIEEENDFNTVSLGCDDLGKIFNDLRDLDIFNISIKSPNDLEEEQEESEEEKPLTPGIGMIAVSPGEGITEVFKELGITKIIHGGQTMNPSTEDFLDAIKAIPFTKIIIFPNNKNIFMAAEQAEEFSDREIVVVPTTSVPECISAAILLDPELSTEENKENMIEALGNIKVAQITYSIRDININGMSIKKNDIMAISEGDIVANGQDLNEVSMEAFSKMTDEDSSVATIIFGKDVDEDTAEALGDMYESKFPDVQVEIINGKQPVYYYFLSVE